MPDTPTNIPEENDDAWLQQFFGSILGIIVLAVLLSIVVPKYLSARYSDLRDEMLPQIEEIKQLELAYFAKHGEYLAVSPYLAAPMGRKYPWKSEDAGLFNELCFSPDIETRCSFSVVITEDDFQVIGISDVDGDAILATYIATKDTEPTLQTSPKIY